MLAGLAVVVLRQGLVYLSNLQYLESEHKHGWALGLSLLLFFVLCGSLSFKLIFSNAGWARRIVGHAQGPQVSEKWIAAGFRLSAFFCGLLILSLETRFIARSAAFLVIAAKVMINMVVYRYVDEMFLMSAMEWLHLLADVCTISLGTYLAVGAPHYVRMQMKMVRAASRDAHTVEGG
jgi:hypothetical protein